MSEQPLEAPAEPWVPTPGVFWSRTAEEWKQRAAECMRTREESWQRSDTDGFMTQWANQEMASRYEACARVAENNGTLVVRALFDLDGNLVPAKHVKTKYGWSWGVYGEGYPEDTTFAWWFRESQAQDEARARATDARKGIYVGLVRVRAAMDSNYMIFPTPDVLEVVDNGTTIIPTDEEEQNL